MKKGPVDLISPVLSMVPARCRVFEIDVEPRWRPGESCIMHRGSGKIGEKSHGQSGVVRRGCIASRARSDKLKSSIDFELAASFAHTTQTE